MSFEIGFSAKWLELLKEIAPGARPIRAREEQADKLAGECLTIADEVKADSAQVAKARLQVDVRKWHAGKLAPKKYGDHISHDVKGPGPDFQPAIYITVDGQPLDEFARLNLHPKKPTAFYSTATEILCGGADRGSRPGPNLTAPRRRRRKAGAQGCERGRLQTLQIA